MLDEFMAFSCARCLLCFIHFGLGGLKWVSLEPLSVVCFVPLWKNQFALTSHTPEERDRERLRRPNCLLCVLFCSAARVEKWTIPWGRSENEDEIRQMEIHVWQTAYIRWLISGKIVSTNSPCVQECGIFIFWKLEKIDRMSTSSNVCEMGMKNWQPEKVYFFCLFLFRQQRAITCDDDDLLYVSPEWMTRRIIETTWVGWGGAERWQKMRKNKHFY